MDRGTSRKRSRENKCQSEVDLNNSLDQRVGAEFPLTDMLLLLQRGQGPYRMGG